MWIPDIGKSNIALVACKHRRDPQAIVRLLSVFPKWLPAPTPSAFQETADLSCPVIDGCAAGLRPTHGPRCSEQTLLLFKSECDRCALPVHEGVRIFSANADSGSSHLLCHSRGCNLPTLFRIL